MFFSYWMWWTSVYVVQFPLGASNTYDATAMKKCFFETWIFLDGEFRRDHMGFFQKKVSLDGHLLFLNESNEFWTSSMKNAGVSLYAHHKRLGDQRILLNTTFPQRSKFPILIRLFHVCFPQRRQADTPRVFGNNLFQNENEILFRRLKCTK